MSKLADELSKLDNPWDAICKLTYKVDDIATEKRWDELRDMIVEQMFAEPINEASEKLFRQEEYLMRLCCRYKTFEKSDFNIVTIDEKRDRFRIANYDYKTFVWAKKVYDKEIDNNFIYMPYEKLTKPQIEAFKKKAINNY